MNRRKIFSLVFIAIMIAMVLLERNIVFAADEPEVTLVEIIKVYGDDPKYSINIFGKNLKGRSIRVDSSSRLPIWEGTASNDSFGIDLKNITDTVFRVVIDGNKFIYVKESQMPTLNSTNNEVKIGDKLIITGTNLKMIKDSSKNVKVSISGEGTLNNDLNIEDIEDGGQRLSVTITGGELGLKDIVFEREIKPDTSNSYPNELKPKVIISHTYKEKFRLVSELEISDDLEMFPIRGDKGDTVYFKGTSIPQNISVFFLKEIDGTDPYSIANMGKNPTLAKDYDGNSYIFTIQVPDIPEGEYYVVLTNSIKSGQDPQKSVTSTKVMKQKFTVIQGKNKMKINSIEPSSGPDTGSEATVIGEYLGSLNIDSLKYSNSTLETSGEKTDQLTLTYTLDDGTYNDKTISKIVKKITVIIGNKAIFREDSSFKNNIDRLNIIVPSVGDAEINPIKNVIVETETILYDGNTILYTFKERAELPNSYRFISSKITPEITSVTPNKVQVINNGTEYNVPQDILISIEGKNFMVYKMKVESGEIVTRYPIIQIGSNIVLDKNNNNNIQLIVLDNSGNVIDGSENRESGTKILLYIPKNTQVLASQIGKNDLTIINPIRNSDERGLSATKVDAIEFVIKDEDNTPIIESVFPKTVSTKGGEEITITGSNFKEGVKVYLDGKEITKINRSGDGKTITFIAPAGRNGKTQLLVMNPSGDSAVSDFFYLETYTNPIIKDFAPKRGNTGTLVVIKGDNFLKPDPTVSPNEVDSSTFNIAIYRLIGTRVLLGGKDINEYNENMTLQTYTQPDDNPILTKGKRADGGEYAKLSDYYHSVMLQGDNDSFYVFDISSTEVPILTNGKGDDYYIYLDNYGNFIAKKSGGTEYSIDIDSNTLKLKNKDNSSDILTLTLKTVYKVENGKIVGNRVKVIDKNTIYFTVPILDRDGWYDLAVENPDTSRDVRRGQQGFYYYYQPQTIPVIIKIDPSEGSTDGGYIIDIIGEGFIDDGVDKSKVYIGGVEVPAIDVQVLPGGRTIKVKVPKYDGDLQEEGTDRITVPVVVVNPDGASTSKEDGFTYIVPKSYPKITRIVPADGSAAGGEIVEIFGQDFRFYEPFSDDNRNQIRDENELFVDLNGNGKHDDLRIIVQDGNTIYIRGIMEWEQAIEYLKSRRANGTEEQIKNDLISILPSVYFGNTPVEVIEYGNGYLKVITPIAEPGIVDVYVVNKDQGTSNTVKFTFKGSNPTITSIVPNVGKKQGKDVVAIHGINFIKNNNIKILGQSTDIPEALVKFGNITNKNIPRELQNSGRIDNNRTTVRLAGGLTISYNASATDNNLQVEIDEGGKKYTGTFKYDGSLTYLPVNLLTNDGQSYNGYELIQLRVDQNDRRLFVERGYSPKVIFQSSSQLLVYTPSYYTIGQVSVEVINPDGGTAKGTFEYKNPDSKPQIINITRDGKDPAVADDQQTMILRVHYQGGSIITIEGKDFRENAIIKIGDVLTINSNSIQYDLPTKLTFNMPAVNDSALDRLHRVIVINEDGGTASSDDYNNKWGKPIYIQFIKGESNPSIESIFPDRGPSRGGTTVTITGKDFRATMEGFEGKLKVYFGDMQVPDEDVNVVDYKTIIVKTPPGNPGRVEVKVENPDGSISRPTGYFTYISGPIINRVEDPTTGNRIIYIPVKGSREIKLVGKEFMEGAKVIFAPVIRKAETGETGQIINIDGVAYVLEGGAEGRNVTFIDDETVIVTTPEGKLGDKGVMLINPDGGATPIYELIYDLPGLDAPENVVAEYIFDRYIRIHWSAVTGAAYYDLYEVVRGREEYIGSTDLTSYIYKDIQPNTTYRFIVRAVGEFGSSESSNVSNSVTTGKNAGYQDEQGPLGGYTSIERTGNALYVTLGKNDYKGLNIDLTKKEYKGVEEVIISIPIDLVFSTTNSDVIVIGEDYQLSFKPTAFKNNSYRSYQGDSSVGIKFTISYNKGNTNLSDMTSLSNQLSLKGELYKDKDKQNISNLASYMNLTMKYDTAKANLRRITNKSLYYYDENKLTWNKVQLSNASSTDRIQGLIMNLGVFAILGNRR